MRKMIALVLATGLSIHPALAHPDGSTYREVWTAFIKKAWAQDGVSPEDDQDFFDCIVNEAMGTFTPAELGRLDEFVRTMNVDLQPEAEAIIRNRDGRIGDLKTYVVGKCGALKG